MLRLQEERGTWKGMGVDLAAREAKWNEENRNETHGLTIAKGNVAERVKMFAQKASRGNPLFGRFDSTA